METVAENLPNARVMVRDGFGNLWVSRPSAGIVSQLVMSGGIITEQHDLLRGLDRPHGLAIDPQNGFTLYVAQETTLSRVHLYSDAPLETIATFPPGGRHFTRTLGFGPDGRLYVSLGSTCDVCVEPNELHGTIISMNPDGSDQKIYARGLRNAVFFTWHPVDGSMWATEMGRDMLGDDLPPDEVNIIKEGAHYGWPYCYGDRIRDTSFEPQTAFDCSITEPPKLLIPAHSAPLGLSFIPEEGWPAGRSPEGGGWPEEYWYDLLVALHGSWNRSAPAGYSIARFPLNAEGKSEGPMQEFITGWKDGSATLGRPVDLRAEPGGALYITDDRAGVVYRVSHQ